MANTLTAIIQIVQQNGATLIAVSKTHSAERIKELYDLGIRDFGENKVQEMASKAEQLPGDIRWHLIGHLQTNKVRMIAPFVHLIHSVDSLRLLEEINKQAAANGRRIPVLFQFRIAREETKYGIPIDDHQWLTELDWRNKFSHVIPFGVMGMATFTDDTNQIRDEFHRLHATYQELKGKFFVDQPAFREISMGMSSDFQIALEEGSTMVRIGSLLFGDRSV